MVSSLVPVSAHYHNYRLNPWIMQDDAQDDDGEDDDDDDDIIFKVKQIKYSLLPRIETNVS